EPETLRTLIEELAAEDRVLKVPVRLLAAVDRADGPPRLREHCLGAARIALLTNRSIRDVPEMMQALEERGFGDAQALLTRAADALQSAKPTEPAATKAHMTEAAENGLLGLALYFSIHRNGTVEQLVRHLDVTLLSGAFSSAERRTGESTKALLVESHPAALGAVSEAWQSAVRDANSQTDAADRLRRAADEAAEQAERSLLAANEEAEQLRRRIDEHEAAIEELDRSLKSEQQARRVESSHAIDDYEQLRARVIRLLDGQLGLLEDGLHALRHGSTSVTEEFLERVIDDTVKQLGRLRETNATEEGGT
ncbi:MAG: hypothetical protein ACOYOQ_15070, partial [Microthrixaceae bacterium]